MQFGPLSLNEQAATGFTHWFQVTADDFTETSTATAETISTLNGGPIYTFAIGEAVTWVGYNLKTAFADASDSAFNDCTFSVGDSSGGVATIMSAQQLNVNGTEILHKFAATSGTPLTGFTSAVNLTLTLNSMTAKAQNDLDTGELVGFLRIINVPALSGGFDAGPLLVK